MLGFNEYIKLMEDGVPVNCAGAGNVAGIGIGPDGEPGVPAGETSQGKRKKKSPLLAKLLDRWSKK